LDRFVIQGGKRLTGEVTASGAKNAVLPIMAATLLTSQECRIGNVPRVADVTTMRRVLEVLGSEVTHTDHELVIRSGSSLSHEAPYDLVRTMRASYYVLGPLLARAHRARVSLPGGCAIGARPIDLHLRGMGELGADVAVEHGYVVASCGRLQGNRMSLLGPVGSSVGATINVMMAATLAEGTTVIEGAALEPEVSDVASFLRAMGAAIEGDGTPFITIHGVEELHGAEHETIPDRIETGTLAAAAAITGGEISIAKCRPDDLQAVLSVLRKAGVSIEVGDDHLAVWAASGLRSVDVTVAPYPGFPTDMQAQITALMSITPGTSIITETIFENRFLHVSELLRLGAEIKIEGSSAIVRGVERLSGAYVMASDLRASAALVLAGLVASGETVVRRVYHLDRGYERFDEKLAGLGARIRREEE